MTAALAIRDLHVELGQSRHNRTEVVKGISLDLVPGRIQGLAGESGSGKSMTAMAILGLLPAGGTASGSIVLGGAGKTDVELVGMTGGAYRAVRGKRIGMVFQDPSASLHPQITVGAQLADGIRTHLKLSRAEARKRASELLALVRVPNPEEALQKYPHQFSGGQRQRIAIAIALACEPEVLLADEPTTALDVTVQAGILHLLRDLATERDLAVLLVTHDLGVMSAVADEVAVMRGGLIVESGSRQQVFQSPQHPYTRELLDAMPDAQDSLVDGPADAGSGAEASPAPSAGGTTDADDPEETR
ncbi:ABC transporter ATP-binding protein [Microbacterium azadirachtae]|uniref:Oligopeptide transport ATP-binding protein OppD n=1 Tax=Microbacterium azadirachtae TaxID=582680 RepID=A0A0F0LN51_9MICO|nr:ABC transporter ATP-binding protein [Microbacterium azadirachtae]KJL34119.1 Oligopeptide transport ATP-binding protein OppD [Microbacterium azadirachtae]